LVSKCYSDKRGITNLRLSNLRTNSLNLGGLNILLTRFVNKRRRPRAELITLRNRLNKAREARLRQEKIRAESACD
jgi:hypothetical protein